MKRIDLTAELVVVEIELPQSIQVSYLPGYGACTGMA